MHREVQQTQAAFLSPRQALALSPLQMISLQTSEHIKQKRNPVSLTPAKALTQDLPLTHWDILLIAAVGQVLLNSSHSPVKNNYKCLIQDTSPSVFKHYSCAHIQTETDNVFGEDECPGRKTKHQLFRLLKSTIHYSQFSL